MGKAIRINVVGSSGSGKTTVARQLSQALDLPHIELDALFWMADWTPRSEVEFLADITSALRAPGWVLDGNYSRTTPLKWAHVDTVIWLDLPFWQILWQSLARTLKRSLTGEQLWEGNQETIKRAFFSKDSILLWSATNLRRVRSQYQAAMSDPKWDRICFVRITSHSELKALLADPTKLLEMPIKHQQGLSPS
jgi:adenylate kinase family enzyme